MKKLNEWIYRHKFQVVLIIFGIFILPLLVVHILFKVKAPFEWLIAEWGAGDLIAYIGTFLLSLELYFWGILLYYKMRKQMI